MVENVMAIFYPDDSASSARALQLLDGLLTQSREVVLANMRQSASSTLKILKSLYPQADLDVLGEVFMATCTKDEANKLVEASAVMTSQIVEVILMSTSM
jgi:hypothetical protein